MMTRWAWMVVLGCLCLACEPQVRQEATTSAAAAKEGPSTCPKGARQDEPRRQRLLSMLLAAGEESRRLALRGRDKVRFCFMERKHSVVTTEGKLLLDPRWQDGELAARVGHLLFHVVEGLPYRDRGTDSRTCQARVAEALRREAQSLALELRLRKALQVGKPTVAFEFTAEVRSAPEGERTEVIYAYLQAHPHGGPGIDALGAGYLARCRRERSK